MIKYKQSIKQVTGCFHQTKDEQFVHLSFVFTICPQKKNIWIKNNCEKCPKKSNENQQKNQKYSCISTAETRRSTRLNRLLLFVFITQLLTRRCSQRFCLSRFKFKKTAIMCVKSKCLWRLFQRKTFTFIYILAVTFTCY